MVGRLVEQKNIGRGRQHARERGAPRLAAGEARRLFLAGEAKLFENVTRGMAVVARRKAVLDIGERRGVAGEVRLLRQIADGGARLHEAAAAVRLDHAGRDLEQRRLARTVAADEADALPAETESSTPVNSGVPPKVSAMSLSWMRGGAMWAFAGRSE